MIKRIFSISGLAFVALIAFSLLGGCAMWHVLGLAPDLDIEGEAEVVRAIPANFGEHWHNYGGDKGGNRYAAADQITPQNVANLKPVWTISTGAFEGQDAAAIAKSNFELTPIMVNDKLFACTQFSQVLALEPDTGAEIWRYDPKIDTASIPAYKFNCRGVSYWEDESGSSTMCSSRIFVGTFDSHIIALDAKTGKPCQDFGDNGKASIKPSVALLTKGEFQISSAPAISGDILVTGSAISDNLRTNAPVGTVHALDVRTGEILWRFNPIPRDANDAAYNSWAPGSAEQTGHANVWSTISIDEERGLVFLPTGSASPDYYGGNRIGDNRYANSVVALDINTGTVVWDFQIVHHDLWDYDIPAQPGLYQVWRNGKAHDVVAQITKTGHVFVLDRDTGEPFLPIEERPVPQSLIAGEVTSPTQPFPVATPTLVPNTLDPDNAFGLTFWDKRACAKKIAALHHEGLFTPPSVNGTLSYPFVGGGGNWGSAAFDPARNLLIVNMSNIASFSRLVPKTGDEEELIEVVEGAENAPMAGAPYSLARAPLFSPLGLPCNPPPWGVLAAVDLDSGDIVWRRTHGTTEDLAKGLALKFGTPTIGGPMVTSTGLIFIAASMDAYLRAYDINQGKELWKGRLPKTAQATPMSYVYKGKQYVLIAAGGHSTSGAAVGDKIVAFALPD